jgi:hypothetical protein
MGLQKSIRYPSLLATNSRHTWQICGFQDKFFRASPAGLRRTNSRIEEDMNK